MAGFFGSISKTPCITDVFYGTDYHSHLGTRRAGIATFDASTGNFRRVIHSISSATFRVKMEPELPKFLGNAGIGGDKGLPIIMISSIFFQSALFFNARYLRVIK